MTIVLNGLSLKVEVVVRVARGGEPVSIHTDARERIEKCRSLLERKIAAREIMYGVNTVFVELS